MCSAARGAVSFPEVSLISLNFDAKRRPRDDFRRFSVQVGIPSCSHCEKQIAWPWQMKLGDGENPAEPFLGLRRLFQGF